MYLAVTAFGILRRALFYSITEVDAERKALMLASDVSAILRQGPQGPLVTSCLPYGFTAASFHHLDSENPIFPIVVVQLLYE